MSTTNWVQYIYGVAVEGDIVKADVYKDGTLDRVELCGRVSKSGETWYCTSVGDVTNKIHENQIKLINVNSEYYKRRIRLCDKYERINNEQREMLKFKLEKALRKEELQSKRRSR